jgi:hypothetical protein
MAGVASFVYRAPDKALWFGGEGGLWRMADGRLEKVELPKELAEGARFFTTMTHDGSGGFWVGGYGLHRLKDGDWTKYEERRDLGTLGSRSPCPLRAVLSMFTDGANRVWLGCWKGQVTVLDADQATNFGPKDGLQVGNVMAIHGRGSEIWIGGEFGLQQFDRGRFHTIRAINSESLRGIVGIVETANGDLWLNGLGGIVHIRREEILKSLKDPAYQVSLECFDQRAGLPGLPSQLRHVPTAIEGTDGRLWFAVNNGVVWLDPTRASNRTPSPPVSIQSVTGDDKVYEMDQRPEFPAGTSNIQISYAAVSLLNPEAIRFRYKLQEMDDEWHEAARSKSVSYRNLPPRSYRFEVGASDANGAWSDKTATAEFSILPGVLPDQLVPRFVRPAALAPGVGGLPVAHPAVASSVRDDAGNARRRAHAHRARSARHPAAELPRVAVAVPDRVRSATRSLVGGEASPCKRHRPGGGRDHGRRDAVQGLRTSVTEVNDVADALRTLGEELAIEFKHEASLRVEVFGTPRRLHPIVRDEVFRIAGEALRNAFRHAGARQIEVELRYDEQQLGIRVRDDGKGIDPDVLRDEGREGHFGLRGMRERAELAGGKLTVWSRPDTGTEVDVTIPGGAAYGTAIQGRSWLARKMFGSSGARDS